MLAGGLDHLSLVMNGGMDLDDGGDDDDYGGDSESEYRKPQCSTLDEYHRTQMEYRHKNVMPPALQQTSQALSSADLHPIAWR
jgi:hypothetical protein